MTAVDGKSAAPWMWRTRSSNSCSSLLQNRGLCCNANIQSTYAFYGFRALLSLVEEYDKACIPMHESGQCPHGQQCLKKHPVCVKRLYVAIHTREHFQDVDNDAGEKWEISTSKCGTLPADFVSVQNAMLSISAQGTMPNLTFLMSV